MRMITIDTCTHGPVVAMICKKPANHRKKNKKNKSSQVFNFNSPQFVTAKKQAQKICQVVNIITGISILLTSVENDSEK